MFVIIPGGGKVREEIETKEVLGQSVTFSRATYPGEVTIYWARIQLDSFICHIVKIQALTSEHVLIEGNWRKEGAFGSVPIRTRFFVDCPFEQAVERVMPDLVSHFKELLEVRRGLGYMDATG